MFYGYFLQCILCLFMCRFATVIYPEDGSMFIVDWVRQIVRQYSMFNLYFTTIHPGKQTSNEIVIDFSCIVIQQYFCYLFIKSNQTDIFFVVKGRYFKYSILSITHFSRSGITSWWHHSIWFFTWTDEVMLLVAK